ncbi:MAG: ABC transporter permease [Oscillospiraceae bacterium]
MTPSNLVNILSQCSILAIVASGLCFIVAIGGIDLSLTFSYDLGALVSILLMSMGLPWYVAFASGILAGAMLGVLNGFLVTKAKIPIFIATLGTMYIGESVQKIVTQGGQPIYLPDMPEAFKFLGKGSLLVINTPDGRIDFKFAILIAVIVAIIVHIILSKTTFGRKLFTIGAQPEAAVLCGVPTNRYIVIAFIICGAICAFGGMVNSSMLTSYLPSSGKYYLMDAIGAVFIGCTLNKRGFANISGTMVGVMFFGIISNGLNLLNIPFSWQSVARGLLILIILALDSYKKNVVINKKPRR